MPESFEAAARGFVAGHVQWLGGSGGGPRSAAGAAWERAALRCREIDPGDLALALWGAGCDDRGVQTQCWATLLAEAKRMGEAPRRGRPPLWDTARQTALVALALTELSPRGARMGLGARERAAFVADWEGRAMPWSTWRRSAGDAYERLRDFARDRQGVAMAIWQGNTA